MTFRVHIRTVGCRTNQADSLQMARQLQRAGASITARASDADLVVVNSCAVTTRAARDVRRILSQVRRAAPDATVVVTGCLVQIEDARTFGDLGADRVMSGAGSGQVADLVAREAGGCPEPSGPSMGVFRPPVKVQQGCEVGCAYCIVPTTRGPERSVAASRVLETLATLAGQGVCEVVLTGTQLGAWGRDLDPPRRLADLVRRVLEASVVARIRLSSIEPWGVDDDLVGLLRESGDALCAHLHLPLQSGSDRILRSMGRPTDPATWLSVVQEVRKRNGPLAVGTDVLVGFPGETDRDVDRTEDLLRAASVSYLHVFSFSPRPGTRAETMEGRPDPETARRRVHRLRGVSRELRRSFLDGLVGRDLDVILERPCREGGMLGTSSEYARVRVKDASSGQAGRLVRVRAREREDERLVARLGPAAEHRDEDEVHG